MAIFINHVSGEASARKADYGLGFRAKVGVGASSGQRVAPGVVAIPWHWGEKGLSTGSRANDVCIDAGDANTWIPEIRPSKHDPASAFVVFRSEEHNV